MHVIDLTKPCRRVDRTEIAAGLYLVDDLNAAEIMVAAERGTCRSNHAWFDLEPVEPRVGNYRGQDVLIIHPGGYGDQLLLEPVLRAIKACGPKRIVLSCREKTRCVFDYTTVPDEYAPYPLPYDTYDKFNVGCVHIGENLNEIDPLGRKLHASDAKAARWGVPFDIPADEKKPRYVITEEEAKWAEETYPKRKHKVKGPMLRAGFQLASSSITRDYPPGLFGQVMEDLYSRGWEIVLFGSPHSIPNRVIPPPAKDRVINLTDQGTTFRQSAAVLKSCDVVVAPDSALMHMAGILDVPCVALFGPINPFLRTAYYSSVFALTSDACPMAPCFHHPRALGTGFLAWPDGGPCCEKGYCVATAGIEPKRIIETIEKIRRHA